MNDERNAKGIIRALRSMDKPDMAYGYGGAYKWSAERIGPDAADRLESQQARIAELERQLAESQRRERAAVENLMLVAKETQDGVGICIVCKHYPSDMSHGMPSICDECPERCMFKWRGQEAGKG